MTGEKLPNWLAEHAQQHPGSLAVISDSHTLSFGELYRRAGQTAAWLQTRGIGPASRVGLLMGNNTGFVVMVHALMQLRAVLVPLNLRLTPAELGWQLADCGAVALLSDARRYELGRMALEATGRADIPHLTFAQDVPEADPPLPAPDGYEPQALHTLVYSSGTTGKPKAVRLTYGNHFFNARASSQNLPAGPADRWLAVLPLFHVGGLAIVLRGLYYRMPVVLHEGFDPAAVNRAIDRQGVSLISVVTNMLARLLDERGEQPYPASFRAALIGGGPVPPPLLERCARAGIPVMQTYGMTETASQAVTLAPADALRKLGSAGKPLPGMELRIEDPDAEGAGEILLRGPAVTPGYDGRPEATAQAWRGGWFHTGDIGRLDPEGYLYVLDRRQDLIISGGENIYPAEIEAVLVAHPAVEEAGVTGMPDPRWGQVVAAYVKLREGYPPDEAGLIEFCATRLGKFKVPHRITFVNALPRNAAGKLLRRMLQDDGPAV